MFGPTRDHNLIRQWAEKHDAVPAEITPRKFDSEPALLHFLFGSAKVGVPEIRPISWESFFAQFELMELSMMFDESPTFQLVRVERASIYRQSSSMV